MGIPEEHHDQIFEPFFTTKDVGKGTGLGLSQVYGLIKQHNGFINVSSEVGVGTSFDIYLPSAEGDDGLALDRDEPIPTGHGETILVAEDQEAVLDVVTYILEDLNYKVVAASDGEQALATYAENTDRIALVLADVVMPVMGGLELLRSLESRDPDVKVILMTGHHLGTSQEALRKLGASDLLLKPVSAGDLARSVSQALKGRRPKA